MGSLDELQSILHRIDGRSYPAYRDLEGSWSLGFCTLLVDRVQGDPFASPSRIRVRIPVSVPTRHMDPIVAAEDYLLRRFTAGLKGRSRGSGRSGALECYRPGPEVVERSAVRLVSPREVEIRLCAGLPARGRRILGREALRMFTEDLKDAVHALGSLPGLERHVSSVRRQQALRAQLSARGLVAFIEDGSVLPRASGVSQRPLRDAIPFVSPPSLRVSLETPEGMVTGAGIPRGVTVLTGGGFHGKSTVLHALARGVMDHIPGDGREGVVTHHQAVKIRAEEGRAVHGVNLSMFLQTLPGGRDTTSFRTEDASGSTSQAAAMLEAMEIGSRLLLLDEDTCATNLMVRDERMRSLIPGAMEPIIPVVDRVRAMVRDLGVSTIIVVGGCGDYLAVADTVIMMQEYRAHEVTERAREIGGVRQTPAEVLTAPTPRVFTSQSLNARKIRSRGARGVSLDQVELDLSAVSGILDGHHASSIGYALRFLAEEGLIDGERTLISVMKAYESILDDEGVEVLSAYREPGGFLIRPRQFEVAAALSRLRSARLRGSD